MGEAEEGSTGPDRGRDGGTEDAESRGFLERLFGGWTAEDGDADEDGAAERRREADAVLAALARIRVEDVSIPKVEIVAVPDTVTKDELVETFRESGMTRLPVYRGTLDTPVGMVHLKDFALRHGFDASGEEMDITQMMRPLLYAPPSMPIGVLLQKMQSDRMHMALVIDEYGGVDGLVTIEDLIEQVVGEIEDEHDIAEGNHWTEEGPGSWLAQARSDLSEFEEATGLSLVAPEDEEEVDTLGGLVFMLAGRVPARGEVIRHPDGPEFEVIDADPRRIKRLRVRTNGAKTQS